MNVDKLIKERDEYAASLKVAAATFREKVKELSMLKRIGDSARWVSDRNRLCVEIVDIIIDETNAENCSLWLLDPSGKFIELRTVRGQTDDQARSFSSDSDGAIRIRVGEGAAGWTAQNGWPLLIKDVTKSKRFAKKESSVSSVIHSLLCLPIKDGDKTLGVLNLSHPDIGMFSRENRRALNLIVSQAALNFSILFLLEKINIANEHLEEKVEERTAEFVEKNKELLFEVNERKQAENGMRKAKEQAEEASRLKDKFVSLVSHDLQSPLTSMLGLMKIISSSDESQVSSEHRKLFKGAISSGERMLKMIETLLNISMLQTGKIVPKPRFIDGHAAVEIGIGDIKYLSDKKGITIKNDVEYGTRLYADLNLFVQVIQNLISNAIKFSDKGSEIIVYRPEGSQGGIAVKDVGVGISKNNIKTLFRHDVKTSTHGTDGELGSGLGLPLSSDIMKAHGGQLLVESIEGEGSLFLAELNAQTPCVLLVDDDLYVRRELKRLLEEMDTDVSEVDTIEKAFSAIKSSTPHLIIAELTMKGASGFELLKFLQNHPETREIPIIAIASDHKVESREKALRLGATDFIAKPVKAEEFVPRVRKIII